MFNSYRCRSSAKVEFYGDIGYSFVGFRLVCEKVTNNRNNGVEHTNNCVQAAENLTPGLFIKLMLGNQSKTNTVASFRQELPSFISESDIISSGGLEIKFDSSNQRLYVEKKLNVGPSEILVFNIAVKGSDIQSQATQLVPEDIILESGVYLAIRYAKLISDITITITPGKLILVDGHPVKLENLSAYLTAMKVSNETQICIERPSNRTALSKKIRQKIKSMSMKPRIETKIVPAGCQGHQGAPGKCQSKPAKSRE